MQIVFCLVSCGVYRAVDFIVEISLPECIVWIVSFRIFHCKMYRANYTMQTVVRITSCKFYRGDCIARSLFRAKCIVRIVSREMYRGTALLGYNMRLYRTYTEDGNNVSP